MVSHGNTHLLKLFCFRPWSTFGLQLFETGVWALLSLHAPAVTVLCPCESLLLCAGSPGWSPMETRGVGPVALQALSRCVDVLILVPVSLPSFHLAYCVRISTISPNRGPHLCQPMSTDSYDWCSYSNLCLACLL